MIKVLKVLSHIIIGKNYDAYKLIRSLFSKDPKLQKARLSAIIRRQAHGIEKGLSMPMPRYGYGKALHLRLLK